MMHRVSKIFWPQNVKPKNAKLNPTNIMSKSQRLMTELGLIKSLGNGLFQITPLAQRSFDKCVDHINYHMQSIHGQKITLPILTPTFLWEKSGRLTTGIDEIFFLRSNSPNENKNNHFLLSPTHEESITHLIAQSFPISYKQLPIRLYQIGLKFRDELKPRFGLMRAKEFLMKDMYTFDKSLDKAKTTYDIVNLQYQRLFDSLQLPWVKIQADTGTIGGSLSHEYHVESDVGEDLIVKCLNCQTVVNNELCPEDLCLKCKSNNVTKSRGIEIGHSFLLGQKYSIPLEAKFLNENGKTEFFVMGCYGIGVSRLIAASLEVLSTENELKWPILLAPFDVCYIPPKGGSHEAKLLENSQNDMLNEIISICGSDNFILDDRTNETIGKRLFDSKRLGYPFIIVAGSKIKDKNPKYEVHVNNKVELLDLPDLYKKIHEYVSMKISLKLLDQSEKIKVINKN